MSLLTKNSILSERNRGLCFFERFDSPDDVLKNGATIGGSPIFSRNKATFNGTTDYISYKMGNNAIRGSNAFSTIIRTKPTRLNGAYQSFAYLGAQAINKGFLFGISNGNQMYIELYGSVVKIFGAPDLVSTYEMAMTFAGGAAVAPRCFMNGQFISVGTAITPNIEVPDIWVGAGTAAPAYPFQGDVYSIRVFNQALSDEEVASYYNNSMFLYR